MKINQAAHGFFTLCSRTVLALIAGTAISAAAHGPAPQKVTEAILVPASMDKVWATLKDFSSIGKWLPPVANVTMGSIKDKESGEEHPTRLITLKDGATILEELLKVDEDNKRISYRIIDGEQSKAPVSGYRATMSVTAGGSANESMIDWSSRFYNKANSAVAPKGQDDDTALAAVQGLYAAGAMGLKDYFSK